MADGVIIFRPDQMEDGDDGDADAGGRDRAVTAVGDDPDTAEIQRLEADIATKRERVVASIGELRRRVEVVTDWRGWVRAHPAAWVAGAVAVGFALGCLGTSGYRGGRSLSR